MTAPQQNQNPPGYLTWGKYYSCAVLLAKLLTYQIFSLAPCYQSAQKSIQMLFFIYLVKLAKMQSTNGKTKHICYKLSADWNEHANNFARFTVPILQGLSLLSALWWRSSGTQQMAKNTKKLCHISNTLALEPAGTVTWWAVMCHHICMLYPISIIFWGKIEF